MTKFLFLLSLSFMLLFHGRPAMAALSFQKSIIDTGNGLHVKGAGDLDGDGDTDLILSSGVDETVWWYQNPTWTKRVVATGNTQTDVETGDMDNDGDKDIVLTMDGIAWIRNNGSGLSWTKFTLDTTVRHDVEIADVNRDGRMDIIARGQFAYGNDGQYLDLYIQTSTGNFSKQTRTDLPTGEGLKVADIDADGDPDIVWNSIWIENTGGSLSSWQKHPYVSNWHIETFLTACDVNGDGRMDIAASPAEGSYRISYFRAPTDPRGTGWTEVVVESAQLDSQHYIDCADFDLDGDMDIVTAQFAWGGGGGTVDVYANQGNHTSFTKTVIGTPGSHSMRIVDTNRDGKPDLYGADWEGHDAHLYVNTTSTSGTPPPTTTPPPVATPTRTPTPSRTPTPPPGISPTRTPTPGGTISLTDWTYIHADGNRASLKLGLDARDMTGDGLKDIVSGEYFYRNPGGNMATTWPRTQLGDSSIDALLALDVDGDTLGDAIAMDSQAQIYWVEATNSQGTGWQQTLIGSAGEVDHMSSQGYLTAQLKSGGKPEILLNVPGKLFFLEIPTNPSAGNWPQTIISTSITTTWEGVTAGDIDRDGDLDVASATNGDTALWWRNPQIGGGSWSQFTIGTLPNFNADRFRLADLDGDGDLDLIVTAANGPWGDFTNGVYWFRSPSVPTSAWTRNTIITSASQTYNIDTFNSMDVADMDHDGDNDIVAADHRGARQMFVFENSGSGTFTTHLISEGIENHLGSRLFDLDNDDDLDIIGIGWDEHQDLHIWRNDAQSGGPVATPTPGNIPGDANGDQVVDEEDYSIWHSHYRQSISGVANGDFDGNSIVDGRDYVIWMNNYGG